MRKPVLTQHADYTVNAFDRPIEEVQNWVAGFYLSLFLRDNERCKMYLHHLDCSKRIAELRAPQFESATSLLKHLPALVLDIALRRPGLQCRLYSAEGSDRFTFVEVNSERNDGLFPFGLFSKLMNCKYYSFRYRQHEKREFHASFSVLDGVSMPRSVTVHGEGGWSFDQRGRVLDFEDISYYVQKSKKERLNDEVLKIYMNKIGVDHSSYLDRNFACSVELSPKAGGESLDRFENFARKFLETRTLGRPTL